MDFQAFAENELSIVIDSIPTRICDKYTSAFRKRESDLSESGGTDFALIFGLLAEATSMWLDTDEAEPLQPLIVFDNGTSSATPQNIKDENIEMLANLLPHIHDAELQARIADILWLRKRDYRSAKQAIKSYIDSARHLHGTEHWIVHTLERIERAIQLARNLNDQESLQSAIGYLEELLEEAKGNLEVDLYIPLHLLKLLQKQRLHKERASEFAALAEQGVLSAERQNKWDIAQQYWDNAAKWYQFANNTEQARLALIASAECDVQQAHKAAEETPPRYLAAHAFIEQAIVALRRIGGQQQRIDELQLLLIEYGEKSLNQMEHVSFSVDMLPFVEQAQKAIAGHKLEDVLFIWAHLTSLPKLEDLRNEAKKNISQNPLRFLVSSRTLNALGKTVARQVGSDLESDDTIKNEMIRLITLHQDVAVASTIGPALYQMNMEHNIRTENLLPILKHNPLVPSGHEEIYARGLVAGLRNDILVSAHLLIPQLENSLREALILNGKITSALDKNLIQDEFPLSTIIYWPELVDILGPDMVFNLRALLVERHGSNLRNLVAHGLLQYEEFFAHRVIYLVWLTLRLLSMPIVHLSTRKDDQSSIN